MAEVPSSKFQAPNSKLQKMLVFSFSLSGRQQDMLKAMNTNLLPSSRIEICHFGIYLELGIWNLELLGEGLTHCGRAAFRERSSVMAVGVASDQKIKLRFYAAD